MRRILSASAAASLLFLASCFEHGPHGPKEDASSFIQVGDITLEGGETAAEISAYDSRTKLLFVTNATKPGIEVINMEDPSSLVVLETLPIGAFGAGVNSVAVGKGLLAAAVEASPKTAPGNVVIWNTQNLHAEPVIVPVGALPDMVTFSPNGRFILCANEGESSEDNTIDPVGSVSIIDVHRNFAVVTLSFAPFEGQLASLRSKGYRVFNAPTLAADTEPEYITISDDSRTAWVSLQENNALARIDIQSRRIEAILPLGFKDYSKAGNELDPSDRDAGVVFGNWPVKGIYMPDGVATFSKGNTHFVLTANEGDSRLRPTADGVLPPFDEGDIYNEEDRIKDVTLDPTVFPNASDLRKDAAIGRLKITNTMGDTDSDGDFDELYSFGARSFSIWNGATGKLVYDAGSELEKFLIDMLPGLYDDGRSDDKGVEAESVVIGKIGKYTLAFVGLERADAVVVVDVSNPYSPAYLQVIPTGDAPEGLLFIPAHESPNGKTLLVVSAEGDGTVKVFQPAF